MQFSNLVYIDATGYHFPDFPTILNWLTEGFKGIYGADVYLGPDSQDGQWLAFLAQGFFDAASLGAADYNSFSPATAQGVGLSRVVRINGIERGLATHSTVELTVVGTAGTALTNAIAIDTLQQQWSIPNLVIPFGGTITVTATSLTEGAILAEPGTITGIFTPTQGWQTVTNTFAATPGAPVISDAQLRTQQALSTANPSQNSFDGEVGAVAAVSGVVASVGYENDTDVTDGNGLPPHSTSMVVSGGTDSDIATAIQIHKAPGANTYGTTSVPLVDSRGMPLTINFFRPVDAIIHVEVTITPGTNYIGSTAALIQAAIAAAVTPPNIPIGGIVVLTELYSVAYLPGTPQSGSFKVVSIRLAKNGGSFGTSDIVLGFKEIPRCVAGTDVVVIT